MWNHINILITKKDFKEEKNIDNDIIKEDKMIHTNVVKEEDGILINIHGTRQSSKSLFNEMLSNTNKYYKLEITNSLFNKILSKTNNYYKLEKSQQKHMESKERKLCNNQP